MLKIVDIIVTVFLLIATVTFGLLGISDKVNGPFLTCLLAAVCSLILFICRLIMGLLGRNKDEGTMEAAPAGMNRFLARQSVWLKDWCAKSHDRDKISSYLWVLGITAILTVIGFLAGYSFPEILRLHMPMGLIFGEILVALCWPLTSLRNNWKRLIKKMRKRLQKELPSEKERDEYFVDYFNTEGKWELIEKDKNSVTRVMVGAKYWTYMTQLGNISIVDPQKIDHIDIFEEIITVTVNHVRTRTYHYPAEFFSNDENPKKRLIDRYSFDTREALNAFIQLVLTRPEGKIPVQDLGTKNV